MSSLGLFACQSAGEKRKKPHTRDNNTHTHTPNITAIDRFHCIRKMCLGLLLLLLFSGESMEYTVKRCKWQWEQSTNIQDQHTKIPRRCWTYCNPGKKVTIFGAVYIHLFHKNMRDFDRIQLLMKLALYHEHHSERLEAKAQNIIVSSTYKITLYRL